MSSPEHSVRLMSTEISILNHSGNNRPPKVTEIRSKHIELLYTSDPSGKPNESPAPKRPTFLDVKH
jgi:hypothetical protein